MNYGYNNEGQTTSVSGPSGSYSYTFDGMARPTGMTGAATVSKVTYNAADQLLTMTHDGVQETRQYNSRLQLTRITVPGQVDLEYRYSATQNNGQITSLKNWVNGEEVNYGYDALGRLTSAATTGPEWGLTFTYDGFGNKTAQTVTKGSGPTMSIGVDGNNRVVGHSYDAAGFPTAVPGTFSALTWDGLGRLQSAAVQGGATDSYVYDPSNQRVWRNNQLFLRGIGGGVLEIWNFDPGTKMFTGLVKKFGYFAARKVGQKEDRQGTVQNGSRFYPYGEESTATGNDTDKFATYWRDSNTGLDYAMNRYYQATLGRFMSPDPYRGSASVGRSGSWNRYGYVEGDPVNSNDPSGLDDEDVDEGPRGSFIYSASGMFGSASNASSYIYDSEDCAEPPCPVEVQLPRGQSQRPQAAVDTSVPGGEEAGLAPTRESMLRDTLERLRQGMNGDCAKALGARDVQSAIKTIAAANIGFKDLGPLEYATNSKGVLVATEDTAPAEFKPNFFAGGRINLNTQVNWTHPETQLTIQDGHQRNMDLTANHAHYLGVPSMNRDQYMSAIVSHEFAHKFNMRGNNPDRVDVDRRIYASCVH